MKKLVAYLFVMALSLGAAWAQGKKAEIKFDETTHDFGTFSEATPVVSCEFTFTNVGGGPLVIHQAVPSCGCTVPEFTEEPVLPGETGTVKVTYNGLGKYPGHFRKTITLRTNTKTEMVLLIIKGNMTEKSEADAVQDTGTVAVPAPVVLEEDAPEGEE